MKVAVERVDTFDLRQLLGANATSEAIREHTACITDSTAIWLARADGCPAAAVGVIPYGGLFTEKAYIWLIWTPLCEQHPLRLMRWGRRTVNEIRSHYPYLVGLCRCDSPSAQAWIKWLGARFDFEDPYKDQYYRFYIGC